jgi:alanine racemase
VRVAAVKVWVEVSEERLAGNLRAVRAAAGAETEVLAVVKANAYGHGLERCAVGLVRAGARWLGVTDASEGERVRRALQANATRLGDSGKPQILVMSGFFPEDVETIVAYSLTPVVWTREQVGWLAGCEGMRVHVEVDTGMGRQGARPGAELEGLLDALAAAGLAVDGVFTHFCSSEVAGSELTRTQQTRFVGAIAQVRARELGPSWIHAGNSSAVDNPPQPEAWLGDLGRSIGARTMVRTGLALYGYCLPIEGGEEGAAKVRTALRPVMTWKTRVLAVRELAKGDTVGYGSTFVATGATSVALLPVGYADGLRRELSSSNAGPNARAGGWVMLRGRDGVERRAGIVGRVSMNLTAVNVAGIEGVAAGDEVVLLGDGVTAEDHARLAETIPYEILCGVRER